MNLTPNSSTPTLKILVIGAGFGGIASALRLRSHGYQVTLIDRLSAIGGRAQVFERSGFRHDAGPTVITAPFLFDELFALYGEDRKNYIEFRPLDPWYRFHFHTGQSFDYRASIEDTNKEIRKFSTEDVHGYKRLLETSKSIFDVGFSKLAAEPFTRFSNMVKQVPSLLKLQSYYTVAGLVGTHINHPLMRRAFSIHPLLVGGNPFSTTSIYALIHYLERRWGVHFTMGGTGKLVAELKALLERSGVEILLNHDVTELRIKDKKIVEALTANGKSIKMDKVICNADPPTVYNEMIKDSRFQKKISRKIYSSKYSMGLFVLFFGTKKKYNQVAHHTIWMGPRFKTLLRDIFNRKVLSEDFSLYIHRPTATDDSFAPAGCDSFYVLCPVPNLLGNIDWKIEGPALKKRIILALNNTILPSLIDVITDDFYMTPEDFAADYRSMYGAGFSIAPIFRQSAWFRFHNRDSKLNNLYFTGAGTHPGAGVPGVVSSAKVVEKLILEDDKLKS